MKLIQWILRVGIALTFTGHGILALQVNHPWIKYLQTVGFSNALASKLMPFIGGLDLLIALVVLIKPYRFVVLWAFIWAFATALIRPLSGEPFLAFVERGANWAAPLALYILQLPKSNNEKPV